MSGESGAVQVIKVDNASRVEGTFKISQTWGLFWHFLEILTYNTIIRSKRNDVYLSLQLIYSIAIDPTNSTVMTIQAKHHHFSFSWSVVHGE